MSSQPIPVFDPQGVLRDVPAAQLATAVKAGGMPAVKFMAPDKSIRFVPASRTSEAVGAGGTLLPFSQQDVKHPGFWATLVDDVKAMPGAAYHAATDYDPMTDPSLSEEQKMRIADQQTAAAQAKNAARTKTHGTAYSVGASGAEMLGVNMEGEEKSAAEGDEGGVWGHAMAVPAVLAGSEALSAGVPAAVDKAAPIVRPAVKGALSKIPDAAGAAAGAYLGHATGIPEAGWVGALIGRDIGSRLADVFTKKSAQFLPELDATGENKPYAGEPAPKPAPVLDATGENKPFAGGMDEYTPKKITLADLDPATSARKAAAKARAKPTPTPAPAIAPVAAPGAAGSMVQSVLESSGDPLLDRLRAIAAKIQEDEATAATAKKPKPKSNVVRVPEPDEDLVGILKASLKHVRAQQAAQ